jgi:hypothetical protein
MPVQINHFLALNSNLLASIRGPRAVAKQSHSARSVVLPNSNAGIDSETAAVGVRLRIITINVTAHDERTE